MSAVDFEVLKLIPKMLEEMQDLKKEVTELKQHIKPKYDLTKQSGVLKYLEISESTLSKYRAIGELREGYHFHRELKGSKTIITYVSGAIEEYKREKPKKEKTK
ncbi:hypothetical protein [Aliarcobacter cryaerophilus]|uniref:hypothetical protein n=1 Tax=Aliarcobacter cryaerophilus TaxID=28198 RepID=UPI000825C0FE|nr:hypothetical protein [Aliarcobacter cryaerophilus]